MDAKFEIKKAKNGQFYFVLIAKNGEVMLQSEMYTQKKSAKKTIKSIVKIISTGKYTIIDTTKNQE